MEDIFEELAEENLGDEAIEVPVRSEEGGGDGDDGTKTIVQPKVKRTVKPRPKLDAARLTGPRGISAIPQSFENIKLKGKHHELDDLTLVLTRLQHWAHRLYPKLNFEDCIGRIEDLGSKKAVARAMDALRNGEVLITDQTDTFQRSPSPQIDPFDLLLPPEPPKITLTKEQKARMLKNRLIAEERRMAKIKAAQKNASNCPEDGSILNKDDDFVLDAFNAETQISTQDQTLNATTDSLETDFQSVKTSNSSNKLWEKTSDATAHSPWDDGDVTQEVQPKSDTYDNPDEVSTLLVENYSMNNVTTMDIDRTDARVLNSKKDKSTSEFATSVMDYCSPKKWADKKNIDATQDATYNLFRNPDEVSTLLVENDSINNETTMDIDSKVLNSNNLVNSECKLSIVKDQQTFIDKNDVDATQCYPCSPQNPYEVSTLPVEKESINNTTVEIDESLIEAFNEDF